jgi:hypothetical protein
MATRKKADSTLLKEARAEIERLESSLKSEKMMKDTHFERANKAEAELESIHAALDTLSVPRSYPDPNSYSCGTKTLTVASRLFAWTAGARIKETE